MSAPTDFTIAEARDALAVGRISAAELTEAHIAAMEKHAGLNAYITSTPDIARAQAKASDARRKAGSAGALDGIPLGIKDLFCTEGVLTTAASHILDGFKPPYESTVTAKLRDAGAVMLGKLNLDEFAMGSATITSFYGPTKNPWKAKGSTTDLVPGGSSGGSAAAVAAHLCMAATGTDTGGSIRQPAAFTGIVGVKPTYGRCSRWGIVAFSSSLDQAGPMTRTVRDAAIMLQVMCGHDPKDSTSSANPVPDFEAVLGQGVKGLKIGIPKEYRPDGLNAEVAALWDKGMKWLQDAGATPVDISLPHTKYALPTYYIVAPAEASSNLARYDGVRFGLRVPGTSLDDMYAKTRAAGFGAEVKRRILIGTYVLSAGYYDAYYLKAQKVRALIAQDFEKAFEKVDAILTPTAPSAAFGIGARMDDPVAMYLNDVFTVPASLAGIPGASVPAGLTATGLPLGLQVLTKRWDEETLFRVSKVIEDAAAFPAPEALMSYIIQGESGTWEVVIGLEVHAQVISKSKLFSGASTEFGAEPNAQVSFVDAGMPGMLPVINGYAVAQAVKTGLGLKARINPHSVFARKNYFYADLPQGYQISQYDQPIVSEGSIVLDMPDGTTRTIGVERLHLEQDAGKLIHDRHPNKSFVDLNRSGVALMEIVSKPDLRSPEEAGQYLHKLRAILRYLGTCDGNMEEGSMRCDANVSVRPIGSNELRTRCEIKNVNSIRFVMQAIAHEAQRHVDVYDGGGTIVQETRLYDPNRDETRSMRSKEMAHDYRYFPDPDLPPLIFGEAFVERIKTSMPELPDEKKERFMRAYGLSAYDADVLVAEQESAVYFETVANGRDAKLAANWVISNLFGVLNKQGLSIDASPIKADDLGKLLDLIADNTLSSRMAKDVFEIMVETGKAPAVIVEERGLKQVTDTGAIDAAIDQVIAANPDKVAEYRSGKDKLMGWFVGQVMKATQGKANPGLCGELLQKKLSS